MITRELTPAQKSVQSKIPSLIEKVGEHFFQSDWSDLVKILKDVPPTSGWGIGIKYAFDKGFDLTQLVTDLSSQAVDDPFTMMKIVGFDATVLLLKYHKR